MMNRRPPRSGMPPRRTARFLVATFAILLAAPSFFISAIQLHPRAAVDRREFVKQGAASAAVGLVTAGFGAPSPTAAAVIDEATGTELAVRSELESKQVRWSLDSSPPDSSVLPPFSSVRYGTSTLSTSNRSPAPMNPPTPLPSWLGGTWIVTYKFVGASFPQGKGVLSLRVPGAGLGTCLSLPNVGYNPPSFAVKFNEGKVGGGAQMISYEDLAYSVPRRFESFWDEAKVTSVRTADGYGRESDNGLISPPCDVTGEGCSPTENPNLHAPSTRIVMDYDRPSRKGARLAQTIDCTTIGGVSFPSFDSASVLASRQYVQYNVQQELQTYYKEIVSLAKAGDPAWSKSGREVAGTVRVAAFLPYGEDRLRPGAGDSESKYDEGSALAIYDYEVTMRGVTDEEAAIV